MKHHICLLLCLSIFFQANAQKLPVQTVTVFKNGRSLLTKAGKVPTPNGKYTTKDLPNALFGTFWVSSPDLASVFSVMDSVETQDGMVSDAAFFKKNAGKSMKIWLHNGSAAQDIVEGVFEKSVNTDKVVFKTNNGKWLILSPQQIKRFEFSEMPFSDFKAKKAEKRMEFNFKSSKNEQEISQQYLCDNLGWTPVYRLDLTDKTQGKLALRAEVVNDAEDISGAELRLMVGIPNFIYANRLSDLVNFKNDFSANETTLTNSYRSNNFNNANFQQQVSYDPNSYEEVVVTGTDAGNVDGAQAEDYFYYTARPGNFPKNSRYQLPIFETEVTPRHFYECQLQNATAVTYNAYKTNQGGTNDRYKVFHFAEFLNNTKYPWTAGAANISTNIGKEMQPLSQDLLPYTAAGAKCKVKIAETPQIHVTHAEGDIEREENVKQFFGQRYDRVKIEGQMCIVNYKNETVTLKIRRNIEGTPSKSEQNWTTAQEQATLRVNPSFVAEWEMELKPNEERKWKYSYEVFVNF